MARPAVHIPLTTVELKRGGLVGAARWTAGALAATGEVDVTIDVLGWQHDIERDRADLLAAGELHPDVTVRHLFDALDPSTGSGRRLEDSWQPPPSAHRLSVTARRGEWFVDGLPVARDERWPGGGTRLLWELDEVGRDLHRHEITSAGQVRRTTTLDPTTGEPRLQRWWARDGSCLITVRHDGRQPRHWGSVVLHTPVPQAFASTADLYAEAFELALASDERPVVLSQFREPDNILARNRLDDVLRSVRHPDLRLVAVLHSNHHTPPFVRGSATKTHWEPLLRSFAQWDAGVVLTRAQRDDLEAEYGLGDRFRVIAHPARVASASPRTPSTVPVDGEHPQKVVVVARITEKKRPQEAIDVILRVRESVPSAELHLYGFGYGDEEEKRFRARLTEPDVKEAVTWHGFTSDISDIYADASVVLSTSATEGFGLALLESFSFGVPVVAWDVPYGPAEIVRDGVDGWLVADGDVDTMAARVVDLLQDPALRESAGQAASQRAADFDHAGFAEAWRSLVLDVAAGPARPRPPAAPRVTALELVGDDLVVDLELPDPSARQSEVTATVRRGGASTSSPLQEGRARLHLPATRPGDVIDLSVTTSGTGAARLEVSATAVRATLKDLEPYRTVGGNLALRRSQPASRGGAVRGLRRRLGS